MIHHEDSDNLMGPDDLQILWRVVALVAIVVLVGVCGHWAGVM